MSRLHRERRGPRRAAATATCAALLLRLRLLPPLLMIGACAAPREPAPEPPPPLEVVAAHFAGTALTGSLPVPAAASGEAAAPRDALGIELALARTGPFAADVGDELTAHLARVFVDDVEEPFRTRSDLARGVRVVAGEPATALEAWRTRTFEALTPGATLALAIELDAEAADVPRPIWRDLALELTARPGDPSRAELALVLVGPVVPGRDAAEDGGDEEDEPPAPEPVLRRERLVLDVGPARDGEPVTLILPVAGGALVATVRATSPAPDDDAFAAALARHRDALAEAGERARERRASLGDDEGFRFEVGGAVDALSSARLRRPSLAFLAQATGATLVGELALTADDATLGELAAALELGVFASRAASRDADEPDAARLGWLLESTTATWLAARIAAEQTAPEGAGAPLAPELTGLLLRRAGEVARYPDLLADVVRACDGIAALDERLAAENRIFLEDGHPAPRVRAFDWLSARGLAPAGYDPLAPRDERRAALEADAEGVVEDRSAEPDAGDAAPEGTR